MRKVLSHSAVLILVLIASEAVSACVCGSDVNPTPEQVKAGFARDFDEASAVFTGEVIYLDTFEVRFKVEKIWKGDAVAELAMSTGTRDKGDGTISMSSCDYRFAVGESYLVYASGSGKEMQAYQCSGTNRVDDSKQRIEFLKEMNSNEARPKRHY